MTAPQQQKLRVSGPVVVTANRLGDGAVIHLAANGRWSTDLQEALVVTTAQEASRLLARALADELAAVGAYVAPVEIRGGHLHPANLRERIRVEGPTVDLPTAAREGAYIVSL